VSQYISLPVYNSAISYSEQFRTFKQNVIHGLEFFCNKVGIDLSSSRNLQAQIEHIPENNELKAVGDKLSTISQNYTTSSFYSKFVETARKYAIDGHVKDTEFIYTNKQGFKVKIIREKVLRGYVKQIYDGELLIGEKRKAKSGSTIFGNKTYSRLDKIYIQSSLIKKYFTFGSDIQNRQLIADKITKLGLIFTKQKVLDLYAQIQKDTNSYYSYDGVYNRRRNYDRLLHEN
jgi:hypothetical protein